MANIINGFYQINVGTNPNDGTGDSFRDSFIATNINWGIMGNTGIANTTLNFSNNIISADAGDNLVFQVTNAHVYLGSAGTDLLGNSGNVQIGNGLTGQFLRASGTQGNVYWSNGASGSEGMVQYNKSGSFGAQSTFVYTEANAGLAVGNLSVTRDVAVGNNVTITGDTSTRDLTGRNFQFSGDGVLLGNFTVFGNITSANAEVVDIGANLLTIANMASSITLLEQAGITWGNSSIIGTANTPNIRFRDIGGSNVQQTVLSIYPGIWTQGVYISANNTPANSDLAPGRVTFGADTELLFQSVVGAAVFSNLQANIFTSFNSNITSLTANTTDMVTNASDGSAVAGRLLRIRNTSTTPGNVGLQIVNQAGGANSAWDLFSRDGNGTLNFGWSGNGNGASSNIRLELSNTGNLQMPYSTATNNFIGFGPGTAAHAGLRYVGSDYALSLEANGAIDSLRLGTDGTTRITVLGNSVAATAGFVGINTSAPISPLTVTGNTDGNRIQSGLTVSRTGIYAGAFTLGVNNSNNSFFIANTQASAQGASLLVIDSQGNVALNLDTPTVGLDVAGAARFRTGGTGPSVSAGNNQALTLLGNSYLDTVNLQYCAYTNANVWAMSYRQQTENGDFWIYQNESGANIKHITLKYNTPSVGINQVNPTATLHVGSNAAGTLADIKVESANGTQAQITAYPAYAAFGTLNNFPVAIQVNGSNVMVVNPGNSVTMSGGLSAASFSSDALIANTVIANISVSSPGNITGANIIANTGITGTLVTAAQPNITSLGTLTALSATGNIQAANIIANTGITGTLVTAAQPNVTSVGTLASLSVTGNVSANTFVGLGTGLTGTANSLAVGNAANLTTTNFSLREDLGRLYFYYGNTAVASLDSGGNLRTLGNVIPFTAP
jgi:hypothetical protein